MVFPYIPTLGTGFFYYRKATNVDTDICIVCPHTRLQHYYSEGQYPQCWCSECNKGEMAGPCSAYFMSKHTAVEKVIHTGECTVCKLSINNAGAHL